MSKVISFAERKAKKEHEEQTRRIEGRLVWLFCPTCETLQYSTTVIPGGRIHNTCGSKVEEIEVPIDLRAEYTIAVRNLNLLKSMRNQEGGGSKLLKKMLPMLKDALSHLIQREEEYIGRLTSQTSEPIPRYPDEWPNDATKAGLEKLEPFGILISEHRKPPEAFLKRISK